MQVFRPPRRSRDRLNIAGMTNEIVSPLHGDDFNDDLCRGATVSDYRTPSDEPPSPAALRTLTEFDAAAQALTNPPDLQALGHILGQLVQARLEPLPERQVLTAIKSATGIAVSILEKQVGELRRRLNATGDVPGRRSARGGRTGCASMSMARPSATRPTSSPPCPATRRSPARWCSTSSVRRSW